MRELQAVVTEFERAAAVGTPLVLATVVRVEGSTYRRPGARLLVSEERWLAGGVSGGCLEGDVLKRAFWRTADGAPVLVEYDSRVEADSAWTHALGCNGLVELLLERIGPELTPGAPSEGTPGAGSGAPSGAPRSAAPSETRIHPVRTVARWLRGTAPGALVTVFRAPRGVAAPGARVAVDPAGTVLDEVGGTVSEALVGEARAALAARRSRVVRVPVPGSGGGVSGGLAGGEVEALVEVIGPPPRIVVFGEGPDVPPVIEAATTLGWRSTLVVTRHTAAVAAAESIASEVVVCNADAIGERVSLHGASAVVLMTHAWARDRAALAVVLASSVPYVGVLGPRRRTDKLLRDLEQERPIAPEALERIFSPVGLDLGAEEPEEIALSIVAEIQAVLRGRGAGPLRRLDRPIHGARE